MLFPLYLDLTLRQDETKLWVWYESDSGIATLVSATTEDNAWYEAERSWSGNGWTFHKTGSYTARIEH